MPVPNITFNWIPIILMLKIDPKITNKSIVVEIKSTDLKLVLKYLHKIFYHMPKYTTGKKDDNSHILKAQITFRFLSTTEVYLHLLLIFKTI